MAGGTRAKTEAAVGTPDLGARPARWPPWAVAAVAVAVALAAAGGLLAIHQRAHRHHDAEVLLKEVAGDVNLQSALEWQATAEGRVSPEVAEEADELDERVDAGAVALAARARRDAGLAEVARALADFEAALDAEFALLAQGRLAEAREVDEEQVDPAFERLHGLVSASTERLAERAERAERLADAGSVAVLLGAAGAVALLFGTAERRRRAGEVAAAEKAALSSSEARFRSLVANSAGLILVTDASGAVGYASATAEELLGAAPDDVAGRPLAELVHPDDSGAVAALYAELAAAGRRAVGAASWRFRAGPERSFVGEVVATDLRADPHVGGIVLNVRDVTERRALEDQLAHQAFHDPLTGLANRALFADRVDHALSRTARHGTDVAVVLLDLDDFKTVNDSLGHAAGDELLVEVAARLRACLRPADTAARLGGDEFAVLLEDVAGVAEAQLATERILAELGRRPLRLGAAEVPVAASAGVASSDERTRRTEDLLRHADLAMYAAKGQGKGRCAAYEAALGEAAVARLELEADLRRALERREFVLHYQPIVELGSGRVVAAEALVRWAHPERGLVAPGAFVPSAEDTGLVVPLGRWVLAEACRQARRWHAEHPDRVPLRVNVNLSARQLADPELCADVAVALSGAGLAAEHLTLEITESALVRDPQAAAERLGRLRARGVRVAVDDFGTGYSSLQYLRDFPVDELKVDKSFVAGLAAGAGSGAALVEAIVALGRALGLETVAEGIEEAAQAERLAAAGCALGQGYHFSRPLDAGALGALLGSSAPSEEEAVRAGSY